MTHDYWLWIAAIAYMALVWAATPRKVDAGQFFSGKTDKQADPAFWLVIASAAISWIFAKSIINAASLTYAYGLWGNIGYAAYYLSFLVAGLTIYFMRSRGGYQSLSAFLITKYGALAARLFLIAVAVRLYNEVWSNTKIVGLFFGAEGSVGYWVAVGLFTLFTLVYSFRSGLRGSLLTDGVQMILAGLLLAIILLAMFPTLSSDWPSFSPAESAAGVTFFLLALVQVLSYPFHDPVLTDRAFLLTPRKMLKAFIVAGLISGAFIFLFGLVGLHGRTIGADSGNLAMSVAVTLGLPLLLVFNVLMLTSAGSTIDSTFASTAKFAAQDWQKRNDQSAVKLGQRAMLVIAVLGNLPLLSIYFGDSLGPAIIKATTISGTMVMGLAPIFLLGFLPVTRLSFHCAYWPGLVLGLVLAFAPDSLPESWVIGDGGYAQSLGVNVYGLLICTTGFLLGSIPAFFKRPQLKPIS